MAKILIVEDEEDIRDILVLTFERKGIEVFQARTGEDAVEIARSERPSVVLLDVTLPGMNGISTLQKIREIDSGIGVVMATGIQDQNIAKEAVKLGAYAYVMKPFDLNYLEMVVFSRLRLPS